MNAISEADLAVYVHWPFCATKCPYCDFNSHVRESVDHDRWRRALLAELDYMADWVGKRQVTSLFFGGGTPSLMPPDSVASLIDAAERKWDLASNVEITLEANPTSVEAATFDNFRAAGITRLSLGLQALDDEALRFLGPTRHSEAEALIALDRAIATGLDVSFDLIYARPGQGLEDWRQELSRALSFGTRHLSLYQLTIEPGTAFARTAIALPDEDLAADLFLLTQELTERAGLHAYEISNHAKPGFESRHNLTYWRGGDYIGIGPGAHGRVTKSGRREATETRRVPEDWLRSVEATGNGLVSRTECSPLCQGEELLLMGLRIDEGIPIDRVEALLARSLKFDHFVADGLLSVGNGRLSATLRGRLILNSIIGELACG